MIDVFGLVRSPSPEAENIKVELMTMSIAVRIWTSLVLLDPETSIGITRGVIRIIAIYSLRRNHSNDRTFPPSMKLTGSKIYAAIRISMDVRMGCRSVDISFGG